MTTNASSIPSVPMYRDKPSSIRPMDSSHSSNMERKESFMFSIRPSVISRGSSLGVLAIAAATLATLSVGNAQANMIQNGDFYNGAATYTTPDWTQVPPAKYGGIGVDGPDTSFYISSGTPDAPGTGNNVLPPASGTGSQDFAFLQSGTLADGSGFSPAALYQTLATVIGQTYTVSFDAAQTGNEPQEYLQVDAVDSNQSELMTATSAPGGSLTTNDTSWTLNELSFTADTTATTLAFADDPSGVAGWSVDFTNVAVAPVPEPAALGLMGVGALALLLLRRRKNGLKETVA
ncbi:MAG: DUF642 domain-containing protein [Phycisphaerae bacterium]